ETYLRLLQEDPRIPEMPDVEELSTPVPDLAGIDNAHQAPPEPQTTPASDADRPSGDSANEKQAPEADNNDAPQTNDAKPPEADPDKGTPADTDSDGADSANGDASPNDSGGDRSDAVDRSPQSAAQQLNDLPASESSEPQ